MQDFNKCMCKVKAETLECILVNKDRLQYTYLRYIKTDNADTGYIVICYNLGVCISKNLLDSYIINILAVIKAAVSQYKLWYILLLVKHIIHTYVTVIEF